MKLRADPGSLATFDPNISTGPLGLVTPNSGLARLPALRYPFETTYHLIAPKLYIYSDLIVYIYKYVSYIHTHNIYIITVFFFHVVFSTTPNKNDRILYQGFREWIIDQAISVAPRVEDDVVSIVPRHMFLSSHFSNGHDIDHFFL